MAALSLRLAVLHTLLVTPVAVALAVAAGLVPAILAARGVPLDVVRPAVVGHAAGRHVRGIGGMAGSNLRRVPGRTAVAALALFLGVAALAALVAINLAFAGTLSGSLLGSFVSVQARGVDYLSVGLAIALAGVSLADVLVLGLRERAPELVTLQATGWTEAHLARLVGYEGVGIGLLGSVAGGLVGVVIGILAGGPPTRVALAAGLAALAGVVVTLAATIVPATAIGRLIAPARLAEE